MKTNKLWSILMMLVIALSASISFSSCGSDDDDSPSGGSSTSGSNTGKAPKGAKAIDLGLSVKWANMNVGATSIEDYGDYFAWGETSPKSYYDWSTYKWCNGSYKTMTKYCTSSSYGTVDNKTTLDLADDAARANWGGSWRMPTAAERGELCTKCTWRWTTQNGVNGYKVTGPNGNYIFLPAAGCRASGDLRYVGSDGYFWSSSLDEYDPNEAYYLYIDWDSVNCSGHYRYWGRSVRAVCP